VLPSRFLARILPVFLWQFICGTNTKRRRAACLVVRPSIFGAGAGRHVGRSGAGPVAGGEAVVVVPRGALRTTSVTDLLHCAAVAGGGGGEGAEHAPVAVLPPQEAARGGAPEPPRWGAGVAACVMLCCTCHAACVWLIFLSTYLETAMSGARPVVRHAPCWKDPQRGMGACRIQNT
jgi:hypothetical protein